MIRRDQLYQPLKQSLQPLRLCSKSFKLGFRSILNENFQMYELSLEKAEEPEIKLPAFIGSQRKQRNSRKTSTSASLTTLKPLTVWITANCGKFLKTMEDLLLKRREYHLTCLLRNIYTLFSFFPLFRFPSIRDFPNESVVHIQ